jgi:hypothetical protein
MSEPFAWFRYQQGSRVYYDSKKWDDCQPLYTAPPQRTEPKVCCGEYDTCLEPCTPRGTHLAQRTWVGLTEDERDHLAGLHLYAMKGQVEASIEGVDDFAKAIEAKLKEEKNT